MDGKFKAVIISLIIGGAAFIMFMSQKNAQADKVAEDKKLAQRAVQEAQTTQGAAAFKFNTLPSTNRNQGLEDLKTEIQQLKEAIQRGTPVTTGNNPAIPRLQRRMARSPRPLISTSRCHHLLVLINQEPNKATSATVLGLILQACQAPLAGLKNQ